MPTISMLYTRLQEYIPLAMEMTRRGLLVQEEEREYLKTVISEAKGKLQGQLNILVGSVINVNSNPQVKKLLYEDLKLPKQRQRKGKKNEIGEKPITADEDALAALLNKQTPGSHKHQILEIITMLRRAKKAESSYLNMESLDDKIYYTILPNATETFRHASKKSAFGLGCNIQTVPKSFRSMFVPEPGWIFIEPDLSQAEARIVAWASQCHKLKQLFNDPTKNIHIEQGKIIYGRVVDKGSYEYTLVKSTRHAANYGEGPARFAQQTGIPYKEAKRILDLDRRTYPEIPHWHNSVKSAIVSQGYLTTPFGHKRHFYEAVSHLSFYHKITDQMWKDAIAWMPQTTVPEIINRAMVRIKYLWGDKVRFHVHGHDAFLASIPADWQKEIIPEIVEALQCPIPLGNDTLIIPAEMKLGYSWGEELEWKGEPIDRDSWQDWKHAEKEKGKGNSPLYLLSNVLQTRKERLEELGL